MRIATTAAKLNVMIQQHIDARPNGEYTSQSDVYLQEVDATGCNWNVEVNCDGDAESCGNSISRYIDTLRSNYCVASDDKAAGAA